MLLSLAHAALVEGILSVDVGFGRTLAFWVGAIYLALLGWGFLPRQSRAWYWRRTPVLAALAVGAIGLAASAVYAGLWLRTHWVQSIGGPVLGAIAVLAVAAVGVLWLAGREDAKRSDTDRPA